jgi:DmsE family decaheme c-type cytochrome
MRVHGPTRVSHAFRIAAMAGLLFAAASSPAARAAQTAASPEEICKACHLEAFNTFAASKHGTRADARAPASQGGCIACHGQGSIEHAQKGGGRGVGGVINPGSRTVAAEARNAICLACHQGGKRIHWQSSLHATRDVACATCHKVHATHDATRDKVTQTGTCLQCHREQRVQINRPSRHPIREGAVACSDCHNPHGGVGPRMMVRDNVNDTCYTCHMEKRGPFVRTHQPVQEDCSICHNPHGTTTPNLLKQRPPFLCQQCHEPTSHRGNVGSMTATGTGANLLARGCLNCHTNIHGTNNPIGAANQRTFRR